MASRKQKWVRGQLKKKLKGVSSVSERTRIFRDVWGDANKKFD